MSTRIQYRKCRILETDNARVKALKEEINSELDAKRAVKLDAKRVLAQTEQMRILEAKLAEIQKDTEDFGLVVQAPPLEGPTQSPVAQKVKTQAKPILSARVAIAVDYFIDERSVDMETIKRQWRRGDKAVRDTFDAMKAEGYPVYVRKLGRKKLYSISQKRGYSPL